MSNKYLVGGNVLNGNVYHTFPVGGFVYRHKSFAPVTLPGGSGNSFVYTLDQDHGTKPQRIQDADVTFQSDAFTPNLNAVVMTSAQGSSVVAFTANQPWQNPLPTDTLTDY